MSKATWINVLVFHTNDTIASSHKIPLFLNLFCCQVRICSWNIEKYGAIIRPSLGSSTKMSKKIYETKMTNSCITSILMNHTNGFIDTTSLKNDYITSLTKLHGIRKFGFKHIFHKKKKKKVITFTCISIKYNRPWYEKSRKRKKPTI